MTSAHPLIEALIKAVWPMTMSHASFRAPASRSTCTTSACPKPAANIRAVLGGSWDLVSKVISTLIVVISSYKYSYPNYNPSY